METINVIDPNTGQAHEIPYDQLPHALESGGQFADEEQKQKAIKIQDGTYSAPEQEQSQPKESAQPKERTGFKGIASDALHMLGNALKTGKGFIKDLPEMTEDLGEELLEHPGTGQIRGAGQIGAGVADIGKSIVNAPHDLAEYLSKKDLPVISAVQNAKVPFTDNWKLKDLIPHIPEDTGVEKALGLTPKKGDRLLRAIPDIASTVAGGAGLVKGAKKLATTPSKEKLFQRALENRVEEAADKTGMSKSELKAFQDALKLDYSKIHPEELGEASPLALQQKINIKNQKLAEKKPLTEIPEKEVGEIPPEPDTKGMIQASKDAAEKAHAEAEANLGIKEHPRLKAGAKVKKAIEEVHDTSDNLYKAARKHYVDKKIAADNTADIKEVTKDLEELKASDELAPGYGSGTAEQKALEAKLDTLKGEKVNASDLFDLQRTLEKMAEDTRKKQFSGVNDLEFKRLGNLAERLDSHADKLAKRLEEVGGKDVQKMIKEANKGWRTYKDLSKRNPVGKAALTGEVPMRSMIEIAKDYPGNDFLQKLVESDPELKKHMLAAYAGESNVKRLLKPTSLAKKYIQDLPEVEEHVNALKEALAGVKEGEVKASRIKKEYDDLVKSMKDAAKEQKVRQDAIKESDALKKQIKFKEEAIPKIEAKMKEVDTHSAEHKRLQKELDDHKKFIQDKGGRLKELAHFFVKVKAAGMVHL
jgi:hypothetical protein